MSNIVKNVNIKNHTTFFDDSIDIKNFDPSNIKIEEKWYKKFFISYITYVTIKDSKSVKTNSLNTLYLMFNKMKTLMKISI